MKIKLRETDNDLNIFSEVSTLALRHKAINLSQGSPDTPIDKKLKKYLIEAIHKDFNLYASEFSLPILNESIIYYNSKRERPIHINDNEIMIIPGVTYGIHVAFATFLEAGDEVIIIEPCYETYAPSVEMRKAIPKFVSLTENNEIDWMALQSSISKKTKSIIVNTPHNPTGKVWTMEDWDNLWSIIESTEIIVISDEVYDVLCYDNTQFISAFHHPEIKNRAFCIFSFEKMFNLCGWKASYLISSGNFIQAFKKIHQYLSFTVNHHSQYALAKYIIDFSPTLHKSYFENKRNYFYELIQDSPFKLSPKCNGGIFQTIDFTESFPGYKDKEFSKLLIERAQVASIPYSAFYHDKRDVGKIRLCFAKNNDTLLKASENLKRI